MNDFHVVRRIVRALAPDYRLLASHEISPGESVLDVTKKTIEVGETRESLEAIPSLLFQVGHLLLRKDPVFGLLFGDDISSWRDTEEDLIEELADLGVKADKSAVRWATSIFQSYWSLPYAQASELIGQYAWTRSEWKEYFSSH
jgi:hypothetical protein